MWGASSQRQGFALKWLQTSHGVLCTCTDGITFVRSLTQVPHDEVAKRYGVHRARVKDLQESAGKFALMVAAFCECLGWSDLDILISKFQVRTGWRLQLIAPART